MTSILIILGTMAFFGLVHSLTAGPRLKRWLQRVLGERLYHGTYRLLYSLFSFVTIAPSMLSVVLLPDTPIYSLPLPWAGLMVAVQMAGLAALTITLFLTDLFEFVGLKQFVALLSGDELPLPPVPFKATGPYALVRHPLYLFSLPVLWASPVMTANTLVFNLCATAYLFVGTFPEEKKLLALYGQQYDVYRQRVPRFLPWPRPRLHAAPDLSSD